MESIQVFVAAPSGWLHLVSCEICTWLAGTTARITVLYGAALLVLMLARRSSAAWRHAVCLSAVAGALAIPLLTPVLPVWDWSALGSLLPESPAAAERSQPGFAVIMVPATVVMQPQVDGELPVPASLKVETVATSAPDPAPITVSVPTLLALAWLAGAAWCVLRLLAGCWRLHLLSRQSRPAASPALEAALSDVLPRLGMRRAVRVRISNQDVMPMTWGITRPWVLLPASALEWTAERARVVLLHELSHFQRGDFVWQFLGQIMQAIYWHHPLARMVAHRLRTEQEQACDDLVLAQGESAPAYAEQLLTLAARLPEGALTAAVSLGIARVSRIRPRLEAILDRRRARSGVSPVRAAVLALLAAGATLFLAAVGLAPRAAAGDDAPMPQSAQIAHGPQTPIDDAPPTAATAEERAAFERLRAVRQALRSIRNADDATLEEAAIRGMLNALGDRHAEFYTADKFHQIRGQLQGEIGGIGVMLDHAQMPLRVISTLPGSPAEKAGILPDDLILEINGLSVVEQGERAIHQIRGEPGTQITLRVRHKDGGESEMAVTRAVVTPPRVRGICVDEKGAPQYWLDGGRRIGYVQIVDFSPRMPEVLRSVIAELKTAGLQGLILDLRENPGGQLQALIDGANLFLDKGPLAVIKDSGGHERLVATTGQSFLGGFPLALLIDETTGSSAEAFALAMQERGRAVLVGSRTYGKGSLQMILPLEGAAGAVKLTSAHLYSPQGRSIDRDMHASVWGADPNDGYFVLMAPEQRAAWQERRVGRDIPGNASGFDRAAVSEEAIVAAFADPVLAAAWKTMAARLEDGEFAKVGGSLEAAQQAAASRTELKRRRDELRQTLQEIERQLQGE